MSPVLIAADLLLHILPDTLSPPSLYRHDCLRPASVRGFSRPPSGRVSIHSCIRLPTRFSHISLTGFVSSLPPTSLSLLKVIGFFHWPANRGGRRRRSPIRPIDPHPSFRPVDYPSLRFVSVTNSRLSCVRRSPGFRSFTRSFVVLSLSWGYTYTFLLARCSEHRIARYRFVLYT